MEIKIIGDEIWANDAPVALLVRSNSSATGDFKEWIEECSGVSDLQDMLSDYEDENDGLKEEISDFRDDYKGLIESLKDLIEEYEGRHG